MQWKPLAGRIAGALLVLASATFLTACGGGSDGGGPAFDVQAAIAGQPVAGLDILPGMEPQIVLQPGQGFELDASAAVNWSLYVNGVALPVTGRTVLAGDVAIQEIGINQWQFLAATTASSYPSSPVDVTLVVSSVYDPSQVAQIDLHIAGT